MKVGMYMDHKEIRKLTIERLKNTKIITAKLNENKRKLEEMESLKYNEEYIKKLKLKIKEYEMELCHIKNAMEPLQEREKQIIVLNLFERVAIKYVTSQLGLRAKHINRLKTKALDTIGEILYC